MSTHNHLEHHVFDELENGNKRAELSTEDDWIHRDRQNIVEWRNGFISHVPFVRIDDLLSGPYGNGASLSAQEALKLLAWLEQEKPLLEKISKQDDAPINVA